VVAADVYGSPHFTGQGGWTWYTGYGESIYEFQVENPGHLHQGVQEVSLDGQLLPDKVIHLTRDGGKYAVLVALG
jgi:cellobiose phosphorylase